MNLLLKRISEQNRKRLEAICKGELKSLFHNGLVTGIDKASIYGTAAQVNFELFKIIYFKQLILIIFHLYRK